MDEGGCGPGSQQRKQPQHAVTDGVFWEHNDTSHCRLEVRGDNLTVIRWVQGFWRCQQSELMGLQEQVLDVAASLGRAGGAQGAELIRHFHRERNADADALASGLDPLEPALLE